ncbi:hypothetical protein MCP1_8740001 [Candidatus Terasakiella magnetica]|nr:hypothetical protein MCP1_8740001 [Candidatus Terasakiella magnetica]
MYILTSLASQYSELMHTHQFTPSLTKENHLAKSNGNNHSHTVTAATGAYQGYLIHGTCFCSTS